MVGFPYRLGILHHVIIIIRNILVASLIILSLFPLFIVWNCYFVLNQLSAVIGSN